jgi:hypothetical protein
MPKSFELSPIGQQGLRFAVNGVAVVNYEGCVLDRPLLRRYGAGNRDRLLDDLE